MVVIILEHQTCFVQHADNGKLQWQLQLRDMRNGQLQLQLQLQGKA